MKTVTIKPLNPRSPDTKHMGDEPVWNRQPAKDRFATITRAFNWYGYFYGKKEAKDFVAFYLERKNQVKEAKKVRSLADSQVRTTTGWLCRMADMGLELSQAEQVKLDSMIAELLTDKTQIQPAEVDPAPDQGARPNIQDRLRDRVIEFLGELEGQFDDFVASGAKLSADWKPVSLMRGMNIAPQMISMVRDVWTRHLAEFEAVVEGRDPELSKAYDYLTKSQLKQCVKFCELVIADCGAYVQIKKVERKPRKVKSVPPEKRAAKFKVSTEFAELKLRGLPAAALVDKSEAWLYDTKKRKLIHLVADSHTQAFTVKNNSVIGYSTVETVQKTLRRPAEQLKLVTGAGKPAARKAFKDITTTETVWNARGSDSLIILKAW